MMHKPILHLPLLLFILFMSLFSACRNNPQNKEDAVKQQYLEEKKPVVTMILTMGTFHRELVSNGTLEALRKAPCGLTYRVSWNPYQWKTDSGLKKAGCWPGSRILA